MVLNDGDNRQETRQKLNEVVEKSATSMATHNNLQVEEHLEGWEDSEPMESDCGWQAEVKPVCLDQSRRLKKEKKKLGMVDLNEDVEDAQGSGIADTSSKSLRVSGSALPPLCGIALPLSKRSREYTTMLFYHLAWFIRTSL